MDQVLQPSQVQKALAEDLKKQKKTHADVARELQYSKPTIDKIMSNRCYLSSAQALRFNEKYGYSIDFLTKGVGELFYNYSSPVEKTLEYSSPDEALGEFENLAPYLIDVMCMIVSRFHDTAGNYAREILNNLNGYQNARKSAVMKLISHRDVINFSILASETHKIELIHFRNLVKIANEMEENKIDFFEDI